MKVRYRVKCERCKVVMPLGGVAVRFHRRLWHADCVRAYLGGMGI